MPTYNVVASATAGPSDVGLKIDGQRITRVGHDGSGNWTMNGTAISEKNPVPYEFRANAPVAGTPTTLKISLTAQDGSGSGSVNPNLKVPDSLLLISPGTIPIKPAI